jgi:hypothetical protein
VITPEHPVELMRSWTDAEFPGCALDVDTLDGRSGAWGFMVEFGGGLTLVVANTANFPPDQWSLQITSGLAIDIPDADACLRWANEKNRQTMIGKYYSAVSQSTGLGAVVYENMLWGGHFDFLFHGPHAPGTFASAGGWLRSMLSNNIRTGAEHGQVLLQTLGGRVFDPDRSGFTGLTVISAG